MRVSEPARALLHATLVGFHSSRDILKSPVFRGKQLKIVSSLQSSGRGTRRQSPMQNLLRTCTALLRSLHGLQICHTARSAQQKYVQETVLLRRSIPQMQRNLLLTPGFTLP